MNQSDRQTNIDKYRVNTPHMMLLFQDLSKILMKISKIRIFQNMLLNMNTDMNLNPWNYHFKNHVDKTIISFTNILSKHQKKNGRTDFLFRIIEFPYCTKSSCRICNH